MSNQESDTDMVTEVSDDVPVEEGARLAEFLAGIKKGSEQARRGEGVSIEEARRLVKEWARR